MRLAMKAFTVYLRVLIVLLMAGAVALVLFQNRSYSVNVWLFGLTDANTPVNVVWVMLATALSTLVAWWMVSLGRGLVRDLREVRREREAELSRKSTEDRVAELDTRQRKIEQQLKHTVGDAPQDSFDGGF
jgi:type VI protein secretion system component VasK